MCVSMASIKLLLLILFSGTLIIHDHLVHSSNETTKRFCLYSNQYNADIAGSLLSRANSLCSHFVYWYADVDLKRGLVIRGDRKVDAIKAFNQNAKVLLFLASPATSVQTETIPSLIQLIIQKLRSFNFDGVYINSGFAFFGNKAGNLIIKDDFVKEFRRAIDEEANQSGNGKLFLAMNTYSINSFIYSKTDISSIIEYLDWLFTLTDNYYIYANGYVSNLSPLYNVPEFNPKRDFPDYWYSHFYYTEHEVVSYLLNQQIDSRKIIFDLPTFGHTFTLSSPTNTSLGASSKRSGTKEEFPLAAGGVSPFFEICTKLTTETGWIVKHVNESAMGPYAYRNDQWVTFDDMAIVKEKTKYLMMRNLGGMLINLNKDDFKGTCYNKVFPLADAANEVILGLSFLSAIFNISTSNQSNQASVGNKKTCTVPTETNNINYWAVCDADSTHVSNISSGKMTNEGCILHVQCKKGVLEAHNGGSVDLPLCWNSKWYPSVPKCAALCDKLEFADMNPTCVKNNEYVNCNADLFSGTKVIPKCKTHFREEYPVSYREIVCDKNGKWNKPLVNCVPECGKVYPNYQPLIINGTEEKSSNWPWYVAVYKVRDTNKKILICGGTIVSQRLIISAGHCFYNTSSKSQYNPTDYEIMVAKETRNYTLVDNPSQRSYLLEKIIFADEGYHGISTLYTADIAILVLKEKLTLSGHVLPVCVDLKPGRYHPPPSTVGKVAGFGATSQFDSDLSEKLLAINLTFVSRTECYKNIGTDFYNFLTLDKFCAGSEQEGSAGQGDSGSGFIVRDPYSLLYYLRGIVSIRPASVHATTLYTDVSFYTELMSRTWESMNVDVRMAN